MGEEVIAMAEIGASSYRRFLQGDQTGLEELIRTYSDALVRFAYGIVGSSAAAEDVAADSIATLLLKKKHFPDDAHMRAYLYRIARNKALDHLRRHRGQVPLEDVENVLGSGNPERDLLIEYRDKTLYLCLQKIAPQYRQILQLVYLDGFSVEQACVILKATPKQVYNLLARAKAALKLILEKEGITHEDLF